MFQAPMTQQHASGEFPGWEPSLQMRSTLASQQVVPHIEPFRCLTLLISNPSAQRLGNEVVDLASIRF